MKLVSLTAVLLKAAFKGALINVKREIRVLNMNKLDGFTFNSEEQKTFEWPVRLSPPGSDDAHRIVMTFECVSMDQLNELQEQAEDDGEATAIVKRIVKNWNANEKATFRDPAGAVIPCNDETKTQIFNQIWITKQTMNQFFESMGGKKARTKN